VILIPEIPFDIDEACRHIRRRHERGRHFSIVVAAEGAVPDEGTMIETRATVLGHVQRGGTPTAFDRVLATRFGLAAIDAVHDGAWGMMVALRSTNIELVALSDAVAQLRTVRVEEYQRYGVLFG
jgi:ATP-dependent phosphofructokinase / diphosphate-dependent phosphofructokinase